MIAFTPMLQLSHSAMEAGWRMSFVIGPIVQRVRINCTIVLQKLKSSQKRNMPQKMLSVLIAATTDGASTWRMITCILSAA